MVMLPASFAQERLWFLDRLQPGRATYNMTSPLRLSGRLDVPALAGALADLVARHESLRTTFRLVDERPMQVVHRPFSVLLEAESLEALTPDARDAAIARLLGEEAARPFDLEAGPLLRARLLRLAPDEHLAMLVVHHIVSDGWSLGVMVRDLGALYAARFSGQPPALSELAIQYADYAHWQRGWLQGERLERQLTYWRRRLANAPPALELPADFARGARSSSRGGQVRLAVPAALGRTLHALCRREGVTPFMLLLSAFQLLLARCTGSTDLTVGTPIANRTRPELEGLIGFFVNTLVMRGDLSGDPPFRALLARTRQAALEAFEHQDLPFERLVEDLAPERDLARSPLFQVLFALQNAPLPALTLPGLRVSPVAFETDRAKFDLTLSVTPAPDGALDATFEYSADLFARDTIERMAGHFRTLLDGIAADPDARLSALPLLTAIERTQLLEAWNDTRTSLPGGEVPVHEELFRQARVTPDATAIEFEEVRLTYAELAARTARLAQRLRALGVGPDIVVGLCAERSPDLIFGLLGILAAGGAVLPLDPAYPATRLAFMLQDASAPLLLAHTRYAEIFAQAPARVLPIEIWVNGESDATAEADAMAGAVSSRPVPVDGGHLVYVIYTSGSTGMPKGVALPHRALRNLIDWQLADSPLRHPVRTLQFSTLSFDASFQEIFVTLAVGGTLVLMREEQRRDPEALFALMHRARIERWFCPFVALRQLADVALREGQPALALREILTAGEALQITPAIVRFCEAHPALALHNYYGPSETHVVTTHALTGPPGEWDRFPPIGRPIANTQAYVLDRQGEPVPIGVPGELFLGGINLARGYLARPEATAERFVPDRWSAEPGARLYRTGDLVKWRPDGTLAFLGRIDHQVKVRGFRVEVGEIETTLQGHPSVKQAVVSVQEIGGEKRLIAYVTPVAGAIVDASALAAHVRARLPEYMIPGAFVPLAQVPLTASGKVDRKALPAPERHIWEAEPGADAPRGPIEQAVADLLADVLGLERLGIHDSFFERGGHSLLAVQTMARLQAVFGVSLPLRVLFETPTVAGLAWRIAAAREDATSDGASPRLATEATSLARGPSDGPLPLSFGQARLWILERLDPGSGAYHLGYALRLTGPLDLDALQWSLRDLLRRHELLRTRLAEADGEPVGFVLAPEDVPFLLEVEDLEAQAGIDLMAAVRIALAAEQARPYDLARGDLLHAKLWRLAEDAHVLFFGVHHIVADAWSLAVLIREVGAGYAARRDGVAPALTDLPIQYHDYARWQRSGEQARTLDRQAAHWREALRGVPLVLELPTDRDRPARQSFAGGFVPIVLDEALSQRVRSLARRAGATTFMTLLAAFQLLLARLAGVDDLVVGTPVANRTRPQTEGLIGFLVNTLILRADLRGDPTFGELLARVKAFAIDAFAHQELPFERLVEILDVARDPSRSPACQVMFSWQQAPLPAIRWSGLQAEGLPVGESASKFDLTLILGESEGRITGGFEYASALFDADTVQRWSRHFVHLLDEVCRAPDQRIATLDVWEPDERRRLLVDWNDTARPLDLSSPLPRVIAERARDDRSPDAGLVFGDERRTWREFDRRTNRLANRLRHAGVGPETRVGLFMERSCELVEATHAIMRAGGVYVPLDPSYPAARLAFMAADAGVGMVVTDRARQAAAAALCANTLVWDRLVSLGDEEDERDSEVALDGANLAYIIYTSGSTGRPKGAMNTHAGLKNRIAWMQSALRLGPDDCVLQKTPIGFDVSIWELFLAPLAGARLVMARPEGHLDPRYLAALIAKERVTTLHFVPSMLEAFLEESGADRRTCPSLRHVVCSGEALSTELQAKFFARFDCALHNLYGPTEAAVDVTAWTCVRDDARRRVPIGRPIDNTAMYVLDAHDRPAPIGVAGELFIGGINLARGYVGRPDLTADRFVPSPVGPAGARLYRTGDRARYLPDGAIEFLGRADHQLKIHGVRVELEEIQRALQRHPTVREAVVVAAANTPASATTRPIVPSASRLIAYIVHAAGPVPTPPEWRAFLREWLPDAMVPHAFVPLDALPRLPNGKLDRRALPVAPDELLTEGSAGEAPRNSVEAAIQDIWRDLLGRDVPGVHDDFFAHGGHSLLAVRILSRVRTRFGVDLPLRTLFDAPTIAGLARHVSRASDEGFDDTAAPDPMLAHDPAASAGPQPLSFGQERLWFLEQLDPGSGAYHVNAALRLRGALDREALAWALSAIVARHEGLRTRLVEEDGAPVARVAPPREVAIPLDDLRQIDAEERARTLQAEIRKEAARPYRLASGDLLRARLWRLDDEEHVAWVGLHHLVADAWSIGVLIRELSTLYDARVRGVTPDLPDLPVQYGDYARWQKAWLSGTRLEAALEHWRQALRDAPLVFELPPDRRRPAQLAFEGGFVPIALGVQLSARLRQCAQRAGASTFMTMLAAFQALLARYADVEDLLVGTPVANRSRGEIEPLIGFFVNTLVMRGDLRGDPTFAEMLARVKHHALAAYTHQDLPFERLVEALDAPRDLSRSPVCQVMFVWHNEPLPALTFAGVSAEGLELPSNKAKFDLTLTLADAGDRMVGGIEFASALYDVATIERLGRSFLRLLEVISRDPDIRLSEVDLLDAEERDRLTGEWSAGEVRALTDERDDVGARIVAQAARTPGAVAVQCGRQQLTYAELTARSRALAQRLRAAGVAHDDRVGLCMPRSLDLIVGLLGVLQAGAAYVPLDPELPPERAAFMRRDSGIRTLVSAGPLDREWCDEATVIDLHRDDADAPASPGDPLPHGEALAYLLYTSGSTGQPKGVMVTRRNLANYVRWAAETYAPAAGSGAPLHSPLSFDLTVTSLFTPLVSGRTVFIPDASLPDAEALTACLRADERYSLVKLTPAHVRWLAARSEQEPLRATMHDVVVGGEALLARDVEAWRRLAPDAAVINEYGPTEATVGCVVARLDGVHDDPLPIGRPISNTRVYVLDRHGGPAPTGMPGELFIGGAGVARGYLGRPALTAERFVPDPFSGEPGARLYRSGDRARWRPDGQLEYLGRDDGQVKLRGHRIELGEVEAVLTAAPGVSEAAALIRRDAAGEPRLDAYVVPRVAGTLNVPAVQAHARRMLPTPMLPANIISLDELPLTKNGKIDRARLAAIAPPDAASLASDTESLDDLERDLLAIWRDLLGLSELTTRENFFERGGHSLAAVRLVAAIAQRLGKTVSLAAIFRHPTVEDLARLLRVGQGAHQTGSLIPLGRSGVASSPLTTGAQARAEQEEVLFLVHPALGSVACYAALAEALSTDLSVMAFQAPGLDDERERLASVEELAARYVDELTMFEPRGPYRLAGWSFGGLVAYEMARRLRARGHTVSFVGLIDAPVPQVAPPAPEIIETDALVASVASDMGLHVSEIARETRRVWLDVYRTHLQAAAAYEPRGYDGDLTLIRASDEAAVLPDDYGWRARTRGSVLIHTLDANHHSIVRPPAVMALAEMLRQALRRLPVGLE